MKKILCIILLNFLFSDIQFNTSWGNCSLINNQQVLSDSVLKNIILEQINNLNLQFKQPATTKEFSIIIYNGNQKINNKYWDWSIGITYSYPEKIIIKDPAYAHISINRFEQVLLHELNHIMMNRVDIHKTIPRWFKEGFAMYFSNEISLNHKLQVANHIYNEDLFKISLLNQFSNFNKQQFNLAYAQSSMYVLAIENLFGKSTLNNIYNGLYDGQTFEDSFYIVTSKTISELDDLIYPYIKNKYKWYKLINLPNKLFSLLPLILVIGFILRSRRNRKIEKKWEIEEEIEKLEKSDIQ